MIKKYTAVKKHEIKEEILIFNNWDDHFKESKCCHLEEINKWKQSAHVRKIKKKRITAAML